MPEQLDYSTERLILMLQHWEQRPEGKPGLEKPAPPVNTLEALASALSLTLTGTRQKVQQAMRNGLVNLTHKGYVLTAAGRRHR